MDKERKEKTTRVQDAEADGIIEGRNAVIEALRAGTTIDKIFIQKGETDKTLGHIASTARAAGVVVVDADKRQARLHVPHARPSGRHRAHERARICQC